MQHDVYLYRISDPNVLVRVSDISEKEACQLVNDWWSKGTTNEALIAGVGEDVFSDNPHIIESSLEELDDVVKQLSIALDFETSASKFEDRVLVSIKNKEMRQYKILRAYHVDSDELVVEIKKY